MDTDISSPIEYNPQMDEKEEDEPQQYYYAPPPMMMPPPPPQQPEVKKDFLASLDKTAYLVVFAAFILGFFMGKTMQPVILRHG
jgi:hypothetical protein